MTEDLEGLKVSRDFEGLEEGEARILTLKDSRILDNEGEYMRICCYCALISHKLQRMSCRTSKWQSASARRRIRSFKIMRRDYTGYDDDESAAGAAGMKRALLSKYDEFLEGPKETVSTRISVEDRF